MKKYVSLIWALLVIVALFSFVACEEQDSPQNNKDNQSTQGDQNTTVERVPLDYLPTDGYNNAPFHILEWSCNGVVDVGVSWIPWEEGDVDVQDGDMLNSAVFDRNAWVEETYGVVITKEYASVDISPSYMTRVRGDAETSSNSYQLFTMRTLEIVSLIEEGFFANLNDYEKYLHMDQPWWVQDSVTSFKLGSYQYVASSEMLLRDKGATAALFFNQKLAGDYTELPDFFALAADGDWTLEDMISACELVSHSADQDDLMNSAKDVWGCSGSDSPIYYLYNAAGYKFAHIDEYGYVDYDFADEGTDSILVMKSLFDDFLYQNWYMNSGTIGKTFLQEGQDLFVDGQSLFKSGMIKDTTNMLKNMNDLYGILPHPQYSIDQENYSSLVREHHDSVLGIPAHAADKEMCAVVLEALSWESYYSVYPIFYDTILLSRAAKDKESKEMLKIIFNTRSYDPGLYWDGNSGLHGSDGLLGLSKQKTSDIAHLWGTYKDKVGENIEKINKWITNKEE